MPGPIFSSIDRRAKVNITSHFVYSPLCVIQLQQDSNPCTSAVNQVWKIQLSKEPFALLTLTSIPSDGNFVGEFKPNIPICIPVARAPRFKECDLGPWQYCRDPYHGQIICKFNYSFIDWCPRGLLTRKSQDWHEISFSGSPDNTMTSEALSNITWSGKGLNSPIPRLIINDRAGPMQHTLWKLALPFHAGQLQTGYLQSLDGGKVKVVLQSDRHIRINVCVYDPYVLLIGKIEWQQNMFSCTNCCLTHCIMPEFLSKDSMIIVMGRMPGVWLPVNVMEPWYHSPTSLLVETLIKRFFFCLFPFYWYQGSNTACLQGRRLCR
nr:endogenous retrovirus group K member 25 Env polyprotein-like [Cavia porcellus]